MNNNNNNHNPSSKVNGTQACAACKYQRRKCAADCILAPYFPHDRHRQFLNAHKLFGVSNITKIIRHLHPPDKDHAMRTIIFQSDVRAADPVGGCLRIIRDLHRQIDLAGAELHLVLQHLAFFRAQAEAHHPPPMTGDDSAAAVINCESIIINGAMGFGDFEEGNFLQGNENNNQVVPLLMQDVGSWAVQEDTASSCLYEERGGFVVGECEDDGKPTILEIGGERLEIKFDDHHIHDEEQETIEQSDEAISKEDKVMPKDEIVPSIWKDDDKATLRDDTATFIQEQECQDHDDLKSAATFFTLTNCKTVRQCVANPST